mgnify:FL=1
MVWELASRERLAHRSFKVWDLGACSMALQVCFLDMIDEVFLELDISLSLYLLSVPIKIYFVFL